MPINESLLDVKNPVPNKRKKPSTTRFHNHLSQISVQLLSSPSMKDLLEYIPRWCTATWNDTPHNNYTDKERHDILKDLFAGKLLPSALETINLVFLISNMDLIDVTHLLRHRTMSFSAICSADRDLRNDDCMVKPSIRSSEYFSEFVTIIKRAKQLYSSMVDSNDISLLDARTVLPRCLEQHYYCRVNLKDAIHFIRQRIDRQIQPESDNIIALRMWIEIVKQFPLIKNLIDLNAPDSWYVHIAPTGRSSNIYMPELPRNDVFEHKPSWFIYTKQRSQMLGGNSFVALWKSLKNKLEALHDKTNSKRT